MIACRGLEEGDRSPMTLRPGQKLQSAVCEAQVVGVRAPADAVELTCGGAPRGADGDAAPGGAVLDESLGDPPLIGKRYVDEELGLELLCARSGTGALAAGGRPLVLKGAKPLPASD